MTRSALAEAAADYLNRGLSVIALTGKTPNVRVHRHGLHEAITGPVENDADWSLLATAFEHPDTTGVGIVIPYPYVVVDIDGEEGAEQWAETVRLPCDYTWTAATGRGLHIWFSCVTPTGSIKLGPNLDLKGQLSYVAAPPSVHPDGRVYEWMIAPGETNVLEAPEALAELIENHAFDLQGKLDAKTIRKNAYGPKYEEGATVFYAQASHDALITGMSAAGEGNRNNYLHWAAATLAEEGGSDDEFNMLGEAALAVGLLNEEVKRTLRSARRRLG